MTFHDLTFRLFPERYPLANRIYMRVATRISSLLADGVIVPSQTVLRDLGRLARPRKALVQVIAEGVSQDFLREHSPQDLAALRQRYQLPERFLFHLGTSEPGKNRDVVLAAFAAIQQHYPEVALVFAGQRGWGAQPVHTPGVIDLGYVPDQDLPLIYAAAEAFLFPSRYEGFGLPILEAQASGTPVISTIGGACAETSGGHALLVEPLTPQSLAAATIDLLGDTHRRAELAKSGRDWAAGFTWERAALQTLDFYREVRARR